MKPNFRVSLPTDALTLFPAEKRDPGNEVADAAPQASFTKRHLGFKLYVQEISGICIKGRTVNPTSC